MAPQDPAGHADEVVGVHETASPRTLRADLPLCCARIQCRTILVAG